MTTYSMLLAVEIEISLEARHRGSVQFPFLQSTFLSTHRPGGLEKLAHKVSGKGPTQAMLFCSLLIRGEMMFLRFTDTNTNMLFGLVRLD